MSYQSYCRPYYRDPCYLPWWLDPSYDDYCYQPQFTPLSRSRSFDSSSLRTYRSSKPRRDDPVKIYVDIRYKHTSNTDTLLCNPVCVEISPQCHVMDVWRAAKKCSPHLRQFEPTEKVLMTDSHEKCFTEIYSQAKIKDEYYKGERHWVFVVYPPFDTKKEKKVKDKKKSSKKKSSKPSCSCCCY